MALSRTTHVAGLVSNGVSNFGTGNYTEATAFTPPNNSLLVVLVALRPAAGTTDPLPNLTISGGGWTYTARVSTQIDGNAVRIYTAPVGTGASMQITVGDSGTNIGYYGVSAVSYTGYDTSTPTGATATGSANAGFPGPPTPESITLSGAPASTSEVFAGLIADVSVGGVTPGSAFTEIGEAINADYGQFESEVRGSSTSTTVDWVDLRSGGGGIFAYAAVAVEVRAAAASTGRLGAWVSQYSGFY